MFLFILIPETRLPYSQTSFLPRHTQNDLPQNKFGESESDAQTKPDQINNLKKLWPEAVTRPFPLSIKQNGQKLSSWSLSGEQSEDGVWRNTLAKKTEVSSKVTFSLELTES